MRETLFRGKRANNNEWIEGGIIPLDTDSGYIFIAEPFLSASTLPVYDIIKYHTHLVLPETVGQYTGLTDKNGKKIFEGDILEFSDRLVSVFWHAHLGCWDSNFLKFTNPENGREDMTPCRWKYRAKVVGNIYDNPELQR